MIFSMLAVGYARFSSKGLLETSEIASNIAKVLKANKPVIFSVSTHVAVIKQ